MAEDRGAVSDKDSFLTISINVDGTHADVLLDYCNAHSTMLSPSYSNHEHAVHELYCIESGTLTIECEGERIVLEKGDVLIIKAHMTHRIIECSEDIQRFNMRFMLRSSEYREELMPPYIHYTPSIEDAREILYTISRIRAQSRNEVGRLEMYRLRAHYGILFSYVLGQLSASDTTETLSRYNRLVLYVKIDDFFRDRCNEQVTVEALADHLSYSKAQTNRILHEYCGKPFSQILRDARIRMAKSLLCETSLTVGEIAARCGYDTRQGFELMFTKHIGMTPHAFREANSLVKNGK